MSFCCWWWWSADCIVLRCFVCITTVYAPEKIRNIMTIIFHLTSNFKTLLCWLQNARFDSEWPQAILNQTEHSVVKTQALQKYTLTSSSSSPSPSVNHHHHDHVHPYLQVYAEHPSWHNKPLLSLSFQYQLVRLGRHQTWDGELLSVSGNIWNIATSQTLSVGSIKTPWKRCWLLEQNSEHTHSLYMNH